MKKLPQFSLSQLLLLMTALCVLLAAGIGAFGKLIQVIVLVLGLIFVLALASFFIEAIVDFAVQVAMPAVAHLALTPWRLFVRLTAGRRPANADDESGQP